MLAVTHHVIVQCAARRAGFETWFSDYALLGDDIVIGNEQVAKCYLVIMNDLGVSINLSKSVVSTTGSMEFAKRLIIKGQDLSPLGPKSMAAIIRNPSSSATFLIDFFNREGIANLVSIRATLRAFGVKTIAGMKPVRFTSRI
jgi:hypothetical protein